MKQFRHLKKNKNISLLGTWGTWIDKNNKFLQKIITTNDAKKIKCPYCKSKDIFDIRSELSKRTRDATVLLGCGNCEGIFGYYT